MGNEIFEEIKKRYKKSTKYMLCVSYEDIGILIQIIETMNKRKLQDMTFEYFNDNELQSIVGQYLTDFLKEIIKRDYISKSKIKGKIEEYRRLLYSYEKDLNEKLRFVDKASMNCIIGQLQVLQSLLD